MKVKLKNKNKNNFRIPSNPDHSNMLDARERDWGEDLMYCITSTMTLGVYI